MKRFLVLLTLVFSASCYSWDYSDQVKIEALFQWEAGGIESALIVLSNGKMCHVPTSDEELYSLVLALYMANKTIGIHCYDTTENIGRFNSKKIHRIGATQAP